MTDTGTMIQDGDIAVIEFTRRLAVSPERLWTALTDQEELSSWLNERGTFGSAQGEPLSHDFGEGGVVTGEIVIWEPPKLLSYTWVFPDGVESQVTFELSADGDGTVLQLTHERVPIQAAGGYTPGWHAYLDRIDAYVTGQDVPTWDERFEVVGPLYQG